MRTRRAFLQIAAAAATIPLAYRFRLLLQAEQAASTTVYLPAVLADPATPGGTPTPIPLPTINLPPTVDVPATAVPTIPLATPTDVPVGDAPILGLASGTADQAIRWLNAKADYEQYVKDGTSIAAIVGGYQRIGDSVGMDWFMALAQMCHETGSLTSFWSFRPQRNPAGIGVTGQGCAPESPLTPPAVCAYNTQRNQWELGVAFLRWDPDAIQAHLGRLLAYALRDDQVQTVAQRDLIATALNVRRLPQYLRGSATTYRGLGGTWAVPGVGYGDRIIDLARRMRQGP